MCRDCVKRRHGNPGTLRRVTPPCGHVHHARFKSSGQAQINQATAKLAGSETCIVCVPDGGSKAKLKPTKSWKKKGWKIEEMP